MKKQTGFSIVECLVYCALFCLLCVLIFNITVKLQVSLRKIDKDTVQLLDLYGALDTFALEAMGPQARRKLGRR